MACLLTSVVNSCVTQDRGFRAQAVQRGSAGIVVGVGAECPLESVIESFF